MTPYIGHLPYKMIVTINLILIIMVKYLGKITQNVSQSSCWSRGSFGRRCNIIYIINFSYIHYMKTRYNLCLFDDHD